ncbi:hypothetical protein F3J21_29560 [Burkholderia sp. Tr-860]|nr:hypothetical protein [Burkholderia sp. Tr-860]
MARAADADPAVRRIAVFELADLGDPELVPAFLALLGHDADAAVRREAAAGAEAGGEAHFIGLPGNPVSSFVTFLLFVRPFLLRLAGATQVAPRALSLRADFTQRSGDRRNEFLRARINEAGGLDLYPNQSSAVLTSTVWADGLIDNPPNHAISAGETVRFLPFSELLG